jgi:thiamine biosynthesis lipoprotein ApbE
LDATLTDSIRLADELVKTRIEKIHEAGEKSVSQAVESMETLIGSVLDATEAATRASATASTSTSNLVKSAGRLTQSADRSSRISTIVLSVGGAMLFISVAVFGFMAAQLSQRTGELESMVMAVGKRVVEMNVSLEQFTAISDSIEQLRLTQEAFRDSTFRLTERVGGMSESLQAVRTEVPISTAESVGRQSEVFTARVSDVEGQIQAQQKITADLAKSMQGLAGQMSALRKQISSVSELNKDVEALVTLQRERYYELLQAQAATTKNAAKGDSEKAEEVLIRYPNPDAPLPLPEQAN